MKLEGTFCALATPFTSDDEIDEKITKSTPYSPIPAFSLYVESFDNFK